MNKESRIQMSETLINALFLTMSGGFQDAYTYFLRDHVFANAQTGNIVLMSLNLFKGNIFELIRYIIPLTLFAMGIFTAECIRRIFKNISGIHWRQLILILEIVLLFIVGLLPLSLNILANSIVSFVCAMQVQSFKKINGKTYASTMCIGNIRSEMETFCAYFYTKDKKLLQHALEYLFVIIMFAVGAGIGGVMTNAIGIRAIWLSCVFLSVSFCIMFIRNDS